MAVGDDEAFQPGIVCNPTTGVGCEAKLDTWSRVRGVETSLTATYGSDWFIKGKTGLLFYEMKTHSDITFFEGTKVEYDEHSGFLNRPAAGFGLSVGRKVNKDWSASLGFTRWLWIGEHRQLSIVENELTQYSVRVSYGF